MNAADLLTITGNQIVTIIYGYALQELRLFTNHFCLILLVYALLVYKCGQSTG